MSNIYVVHPGYVTIQRTGETVYVDAGTLAANYGLSPGEYDINTTEQQTSTDGAQMQIHLHPRPDNKYRNIKTELHDNGTDSFIDKEVGWKEKRAKRRKII